MFVKFENENDNFIQCNVVVIFDNILFVLLMLNIFYENILCFIIIRINWIMQNSFVFIVVSYVILVVCVQGFDDNYLVNYILFFFGIDYKICKNDNQIKEIEMVLLDYSISLNIFEIDLDNYIEYVLFEIGGRRRYKMKNLSFFLFIKVNKLIFVLVWIEIFFFLSNYNIIYVFVVNFVLNSNMMLFNYFEDECFFLSDYIQL